MCGIFTYIWVIHGVNVGKYIIHGSSGNAEDLKTMRICGSHDSSPPSLVLQVTLEIYGFFRRKSSPFYGRTIQVSELWQFSQNEDCEKQSKLGLGQKS